MWIPYISENAIYVSFSKVLLVDVIIFCFGMKTVNMVKADVYKCIIYAVVRYMNGL